MRFRVTIYSSWSDTSHLVSELSNYDEVVKIAMRYAGRYSITVYDKLHDINFEFLT